jgi:SAM-dependent methyltransferase
VHDTVLDVGCGDGYFTNLLAKSGASIIGVDNLDAYLEAARSQVKRDNVEFMQGDARHLPFGDQSVDVVWSGHSMQSYPDIPKCLREFHRILKPCGTLAVLETDNVHSVMLSWPPDLELAVRQAEHREIGDEDSYMGTYFPRFAQQLFEAAGFEQFNPQYILAHRFGAAGESLVRFVRLYLDNLLANTGEHLSDRMKARLAVLSDPASEKFLPRQKAFSFGSLQVLMLANVSLESSQ